MSGLDKKVMRYRKVTKAHVGQSVANNARVMDGLRKFKESGWNQVIHRTMKLLVPKRQDVGDLTTNKHSIKPKGQTVSMEKATNSALEKDKVSTFSSISEHQYQTRPTLRKSKVRLSFITVGMSVSNNHSS